MSNEAAQKVEQLTPDTKGLYGGIASNDSSTLADKSWREIFKDPDLQHLIVEGLKNNNDLLISVQRIKEAEALYLQGKAASFPSISVFANGNYLRNSSSLYPNGPKEVKAYEIGASANWEIDIWGKLQSSKRAAYAYLLYSEAGQKAVQTRLIANIASAYYNLIGLDAKLAITRQTVKNNIELVETIKLLKESGKVTGAAVVQSEATRYAAEVTIPDLEQQIHETENFICLLLGRNPGEIKRNKIEDQLTPDVVKTGIPARLLDHRPDVMQAKYTLMNAFEITKSAKASFYPSLTISGSGGFLSTGFEHFFDPTYFATNVLAGLTQPLFNKRSNTTRLKVAKAQQEESLLNF
jgi:NodT family efflux transporter outer membrane factor (OMF) lipoprotein